MRAKPFLQEKEVRTKMDKDDSTSERFFFI